MRSLRSSHRRVARTWAPALLSAVLGSVGLAQIGQAQVPPDVEATLRTIGPIVDPACTADLYRPMMPKNDITSDVTPLYPGVSIARNQSFGSNPNDVVDVFWGDKGANSRPVLIYVPGGAGNKIETQDKAANAFYDNIGRWGTQNGLVVVLMQRHFSPTWDGGARDISNMIQWVQDHIAQYHGDANRMVIWAHSAGNGPTGTYIGRPELYGPKGVGVRGVIFMSGAFDIAPLQGAALGGANARGPLAGAGTSCHEPGGASSTAGALPGAAPGTPGGPAIARPAGGPGVPGGPGRQGARGPRVDPATQLAHSSLPELKRTHVRIMLVDAELDPGVDMSVNGGLSAFNKTLRDALCELGPSHCPTLLVARGESHMSEVMSIDTPDQTVSGPVLKFIREAVGGGRARRKAAD